MKDRFKKKGQILAFVDLKFCIMGIFTHTHSHTQPDGLCVDVYRSDSLQQELDHF